MVNISGISKGKVLAALYNNSKTQGWGILQFTPGDMTEQQANQLLEKYAHFDYLKGRVMKVDLSGDEFNPWGYDRDNGVGAAQKAVNSIK